MTHTPEIEYGQHLARLRAAVNDLTLPWQMTTMQGHNVVMPPLVDHVAEGRATRSNLPDTDGYGSRPPIWMGGIDWQASIITLVEKLAATLPGGQSPPRPLDPRSALEWSVMAPVNPSMTSTLDSVATGLERARWDALRLLWPEAFSLDAACPECGASSHRGAGPDGDIMNSDALTVSEIFAECRACGMIWWGISIVDTLAPALQDADILDNLT